MPDAAIAIVTEPEGAVVGAVVGEGVGGGGDGRLPATVVVLAMISSIATIAARATVESRALSRLRIGRLPLVNHRSSAGLYVR
jgi:hypothetical protein